MKSIIVKIKETNPTLIIFFFLIFGSFSFFAVAEEQFSTPQTAFADSDHDGLSDAEEKVYGTDPSNADTDGDGYSDGVEVKSGYDPLKPAPGDKIDLANSSAAAVLGSETNKDDAVAMVDEDSATAKLSSKLADFIKENQNQSGEMSVDSLDSVINDSIGQEMQDEPIPVIDEKTIKVKKQDYSKLSDTERTKKEKEDALAYLTSISYIAVSNSPVKIDSSQDIDSFVQEAMAQFQALTNGTSVTGKSYFDDLSDRGQLILDQVSAVDVPEGLLAFHKKWLSLSMQMINLKAQDKINPNDPVSTIVNLSKAQNVLEEGMSLYQDLSSQLEKYGITILTAPAQAGN